MILSKDQIFSNFHGSRANIYIVGMKLPVTFAHNTIANTLTSITDTNLNAIKLFNSRIRKERTQTVREVMINDSEGPFANFEMEIRILDTMINMVYSGPGYALYNIEIYYEKISEIGNVYIPLYFRK